MTENIQENKFEIKGKDKQTNRKTDKETKRQTDKQTQNKFEIKGKDKLLQKDKAMLLKARGKK